MVKYTLLLYFILVVVYSAAACNPGEVECSNGECRPTQVECPVIVNYTCYAISGRPYKCRNGECVASYHDCPANSSCFGAQVQCWDGSCAFEGDCPIVPACPSLTRRCSDGTCLDRCPASTCAEGYCEDGTCRLNGICSAAAGCPTNTPYLCPNGWCVVNTNSCRVQCPSPYYACYNGDCVLTNFTSDPCETPPRLQYPAPINVLLTSQSTSPISIQTAAAKEIAQITFPAVVLEHIGYDVVLEVRGVADSEISRVRGDRVWGGASYSAAILSSVISFKIQGVDQYSFAGDYVTIGFTNSLPPDTNLSSLCLGYVEGDEWICQSEISMNGTTLIGKTNHFTNFGLLTRDPKSPDGKFYGLDLNEMFPVYIIIAIVGLYAVGFVVACKCLPHKRRQRRRRRRERTRQPIPLRDLMPDTVPIDGESAYTSSDNNGVIVDRLERERTSTTDDSSTFDVPHIINLSFFGFYAQTHSFVAWAFSKSRRLNPYDFLTVLLTEMLAHLLVSTIISEKTTYTHATQHCDKNNADAEAAHACAKAQDIDVENACANAGLCACVVFCAWMFIMLVFRYAPRQRNRRKFIAYFFAIAFSISCITATIFYANEFDGLQRETWMVVFAIAIGLESIILQTIKITISYFIVSCRRAQLPVTYPT